MPALQTARRAQQDALQDGGRSSTTGKRGQLVRNGLVVAEISLALITLIGAGLLMRSFRNLTEVNPGFDSHQVLSMMVSLHGQPSMIGRNAAHFMARLSIKSVRFPAWFQPVRQIIFHWWAISGRCRLSRKDARC